MRLGGLNTSLNAKWPSSPIPPRKRSMPPTSAILRSYSAHSFSKSSASPSRMLVFPGLVKGVCLPGQRQSSLYATAVQGTVHAQDVNLGEQVGEHERVVAFRVVPRESDVFVHIDWSWAGGGQSDVLGPVVELRRTCQDVLCEGTDQRCSRKAFSKKSMRTLKLSFPVS